MEELFGIGKKQPEYPWQTKFAPWVPAANLVTHSATHRGNKVGRNLG